MNTIPTNVNAERAIIGAVMLDRNAFDDAADLVCAADFSDPRHATIFSAMSYMYAANKALDAISIAEELQRAGKLRSAGGNEYLADIISVTGSAACAAHHAQIVRDKSTLRQMVAAGKFISSEAAGSGDDIGTILDEVQGRIYDISERREAQTFSEASGLVSDAFRSIGKAREVGNDLLGLSTGFVDLDRVTSGLQDSDLVILAARPSVGKTALALNIACHAAMNEETPVAFFSLEMTKIQLVMRMLASEGRYDGHQLRRGRLNNDEWARLPDVCGRVSAAKLYVDDSSGISVIEMRAKVRRLKQQHGLGLIVVDYMQLMPGPVRAENRQQEITAISRGLKGMAKDLGVPVLALSQLSRAASIRADKTPQLSDLRESGAIEQDADVVMFLDRPGEPDSPIIDLIIGKQRNGPTGKIKLHFTPKFTRFGNYSGEV